MTPGKQTAEKIETAHASIGLPRHIVKAVSRAISGKRDDISYKQTSTPRRENYNQKGNNASKLQNRKPKVFLLTRRSVRLDE